MWLIVQIGERIIITKQRKSSDKAKIKKIVHHKNRKYAVNRRQFKIII